MTRSAFETARALIEIYDRDFSSAEEGQYRLLWHEMRSLAGTSKLSDQLLKEINRHLLRQEYVLIPCDDFVAILSQTDLSFIRSINSRVLEEYLPDDEDEFKLDEDEFEPGAFDYEEEEEEDSGEKP